MSKFAKILITSLGVLFSAMIIYGILKCFYGDYFENNFFGMIFIIILSTTALYGIYYGIKYLWKNVPLLILVPLFLQGCNYAKSNQQVLVSDDCGMTWKKVNAGSAVPKGTANPCYMKVVIPNYPMQGDSKFITNLKDHVRANVHIDYDYSITDPLAFIKQAKYLGKANANVDDNAALDNAAFEGAENMVIDKRIREVAKEMFLNEDIVDMEQGDLEDKLQAGSNKILAEFGVHLNFITLTFDLDEQTRQAIDVSTAMRIYESRNLTEVGKQIMIQRAGATKIIIESPITKTEELQSK